MKTESIRRVAGERRIRATGNCAAIIDYANVTVRSGGRPGVLDCGGLDGDLRDAGAHDIVVLAGSFFRKEMRRFEHLNWKPIQTRGNADPEILEYARRFVRRGYDRLIIVSGDGPLGSDILHAAESRDVDVSFWSLQAKLSNSLRTLGRKTRSIDHRVAVPRRNDFDWLARRGRELSATRASAPLLH